MSLSFPYQKLLYTVLKVHTFIIYSYFVYIIFLPATIFIRICIDTVLFDRYIFHSLLFFLFFYLRLFLAISLVPCGHR